MKKLLVAAVLAIVVVGAWFAVRAYSGMHEAPADMGPAPIATAVYSCDQGKHITAAYYEHPAAAMPAPGEPPVPTGSVEVSFDGQASTTLAQTLSADGARYATADESLVFWNKGNEALIMRDNAMDLDYTNCATGS